MIRLKAGQTVVLEDGSRAKIEDGDCLREAKEIGSLQRQIGSDIMKNGIDNYIFNVWRTVSSLWDSMSLEGKQLQGGIFGKILDHIAMVGSEAEKIDMDRSYWRK